MQDNHEQLNEQISLSLIKRLYLTFITVYHTAMSHFNAKWMGFILLSTCGNSSFFGLCPCIPSICCGNIHSSDLAMRTFIKYNLGDIAALCGWIGWPESADRQILQYCRTISPDKISFEPECRGLWLKWEYENVEY